MKTPDIMDGSGEVLSEKLHSRGRTIKVFHDRYFWYIIVLAVFISVFAYAPDLITLLGLTSQLGWELSYYVALYRVVFVLSVAIGAWRFGILGGVVTSTFLAPIILSPFLSGIRAINIWLDIGVVVLGIIVSLIIGRQGNMQRLLVKNTIDLQQQAAQLRLEISERQRAEEELRALSLRAIESLVFALEAKDKYTAGHSRRVTDIAVTIGCKMNLSPENLECLRCGSLLHDVGKIAVEQLVQNKPDTLTADEYEQIMFHVKAGASIVKPIVNEKVVELIEHHHDRYDGGNLNQFVRGRNIPLGARIIAVSDVFDAMTSDRPYRPAMPVQEAMNEIQRCIGTQFDADVASTFLSMPLNEVASMLRASCSSK